MELICPACEARYQLPEGSISENGRQVSCMNCGHGWHAYPPLVLGSQGAPTAAPVAAAPAPAPTPPPAQPASPSTGIQWQAPQGAGSMPVAQHNPQLADPGQSSHEQTRAEIRAEPQLAGSGGQQGAAEGRNEQLAEIRQMLAEVQSEDRAPDDGAPETPQHDASGDFDARVIATPAELEAEQARRRLAEEREHAQREAALATSSGDDDEDELRRRLDRATKGDQAKGATGANVKKIRRRHDRKVRQKKHAAAAGSGAFLTGFLLIVMIAAGMVSLYVLRPQIVAQYPEAEVPLNQYAATMDQLRVGTAETFAEVRDAIIEKLGDKED